MFSPPKNLRLTLTLADDALAEVLVKESFDLSRSGIGIFVCTVGGIARHVECDDERVVVEELNEHRFHAALSVRERVEHMAHTGLHGFLVVVQHREVRA